MALSTPVFLAVFSAAVLGIGLFIGFKYYLAGKS